MNSTLIISILAAVGPTIAAAIFATSWWKTKTGAVGKIIQAAAEAAVAHQEAVTVNPYKEQSGVTTLPPAVQATAKNNAVQDVIAAIAPILGPANAQIATMAGDAIEAVLDRVHQRLPETTKVMFPVWLLGMAAAMATAGMACGCASLPAGWSESNADQLRAVANAAKVAIYGGDQNDPTVHALTAAGYIGAAAYQRTPGADKEIKLQAAATAAMEFAVNVYPMVFGNASGTSLPVMVRTVTGVEANDADQVLGLILAGIENPVSGGGSPPAK